MKTKTRNIIIATILIGMMITAFRLWGQGANPDSQWPGFDKWLRWKMSTNLTAEQREVVDCLQKSTDIFNKAFNTESACPDSKYGYPNINEAIEIVKDAIDELEKLPCPKECVHYVQLCIENLKYTIKYQQLRLEYGYGTEEFKKKHHELELSFIDSGVDSARFAEYFACMKRIGLFDNIEEESKTLGLK